VIARAQTALVVLVLLGAGVLLGSFLLEWRGVELGVPVASEDFEGLARELADLLDPDAVP